MQMLISPNLAKFYVKTQTHIRIYFQKWVNFHFNFHNNFSPSFIFQSKKKKSKPTYLSIFIHWVRSVIGQPEGFVFVMTLLISAISTQFIVGIVMS